MEKDTLLEQKSGSRLTGFPTKRFTTMPSPAPPRRVNLLSNTDDDLTPLNWLVSPNLLRDVCGRPQLTNPPPIKRSPQILRKPMKCMASRPIKTSRSIRLISVKSENHPYKHDDHFIKPPYSFATLIFMAIEESSHKRLRVRDIYRWILERFPYYRLSDLSWKNSVRHNLSLNRCFQKIDKDRRMECGKGSWWTVDPALRPSLLQALKKIGNVASQVCPNSAYQTPPSSPDSIDGEAAGSDETTAAAVLCMMKRSSEQGRTRHYTPEGNVEKTDAITQMTPVQSSGPSSNESSPEQPVSGEPYRPVKRIISIGSMDRKSAEGVMALLSMANAR